MAEAVRAHLVISGRVQGVFFRAETCAAAERIGDLGGWVRNRRDGSVEVVVEGPADRVGRLVEWCRKGPPRARVDDVRIDWQVSGGDLFGFSVVY